MDQQKLEELGRSPRWLAKLSPPARRTVTAVLGLTLVGVGLALTPIPGPLSIPFVLAGVTVLSWEFRWARTLRGRVVGKIRQLNEDRKERKRRRNGDERP